MQGNYVLTEEKKTSNMLKPQVFVKETIAVRRPREHIIVKPVWLAQKYPT